MTASTMARMSKPVARGFTLVELLVAISILAVVAVLGWRALDGIVRARAILTNEMETTRGMQLAFAQLQSDCEHKAGREVLDGRPWLRVEADSLTMVREVFSENQPSHLMVVSYRLVNDALVRRESAPTRDLLQLDGLWKAATSEGDTTTGVALQSGVTGLQISVWQNNAWRQGGNDPAANAAGTVTVGPTPQAPPPQNGQAASTGEPTGLMVALQVRGMAAPLVKSFLLGEP